MVFGFSGCVGMWFLWVLKVIMFFRWLCGMWCVSLFSVVYIGKFGCSSFIVLNSVLVMVRCVLVVVGINVCRLVVMWLVSLVVLLWFSVVWWVVLLLLVLIVSIMGRVSRGELFKSGV